MLKPAALFLSVIFAGFTLTPRKFYGDQPVKFILLIFHLRFSAQVPASYASDYANEYYESNGKFYKDNFRILPHFGGE